jgi:signal recognition particle subunit SRP19
LRRSEQVVIYPVYLDSAKTEGEGRRIPKSAGVQDPKLGEVAAACARLGLKCTVEEGASHPREPIARRGLVRVAGSGGKGALLKRIALLIRQSRAERAEKSKG